MKSNPYHEGLASMAVKQWDRGLSPAAREYLGEHSFAALRCLIEMACNDAVGHAQPDQIKGMRGAR